MPKQTFVITNESYILLILICAAFIPLFIKTGRDIYQDIQLYRRQEKRWIWYKRPLVMYLGQLITLLPMGAFLVIEINIFSSFIVAAIIAVTMLAFLFLTIYGIILAGSEPRKQTTDTTSKK